MLRVRRRWGGSVVGVVVLRDRHEQGVELVDFVAPPERFSELLEVGRRFAGRLGRSAVFTWITTSHADLLGGNGGRSSPLDLVISTGVGPASPAPEEIRGHWWLMAGDTDFR